MMVLSGVIWVNGVTQKPVEPVVPFEEDDVEESLERIYKTGRFRGVDVFYDKGKKEYKVVLWEKVKINSVSFREVPSDIEELVGAAGQEVLGTEYVSTKVPAFEKKILNTLRNNGYLKAEVVVGVREDFHNPARVSFVIDIDEGVQAEISNIETNIRDPELEKKVLDVLDVKVDKPLRIWEVQKKINNFSLKAAKKGYFRPRIRNHRFHYNIDKTQATLKIHFEPVRILEFSFKGKLGDLSSSKIEDHIIDHIEQLQDTDDIAKIVAKHYRAKGYKNAKVKLHEFPTQEAGTNLIQLTIDSGTRLRFEGFRWTGVESLDKEELSDFLIRFGKENLKKGYFSRAAVDKGVAQLPIYFKNRGLFRSRVQFVNEELNTDGDGVRVSIQIIEGVPTRIERISFPGVPEWLDLELREALGMEIGDLLDLGRLEEFLNEIQQIIQKEGYFYVVSGEDVTKEIIEFSNNYQFANLKIPVKLGPKAHFGRLSLYGLKRTNRKVVLREIRWNEGEPYDRDVVDETRAALNRTGLFRSIRVEFVRSVNEQELAQKALAIPVEIYFDERKAGSFEVGAGVRTDDGFKVFSAVGYRNLWGMNRSISTRADLDAEFPQRFEFLEPKLNVTYIEPWLGPFPLQLRVNLLAQRADEEKNDFLTGKATLELIYYFTKHIHLRHLLYEFEATQTFNIRQDDGRIDRTQFENNRIAVLGPALIVDYRDDVFNPSLGWYGKLETRLSAPEFGSNDDIRFVHGGLTLKGYVPVYFKNLVWANLFSYGVVYKLGKGFRIPREYLFYLGGRTSLRSYGTDVISPDEDDIKDKVIDRSQYFLLRSELRWTFWEDLGVAGFWDGGSLYVDGVNEEGFRQSMGVGIRYKTPVGPFALDYAVTVDDKPGILSGRSWRIHFSVGVF